MSLFTQFQGEVRCERLPGEGNWRFTGQSRGHPPARAGEWQSVYASGVRDLEPPATVHDAELESIDAWSGASSAQPAKDARITGWVLRGRDYGRAFQLATVQLHLATPPALAAQFEPAPAPLAMRALAWLALNLARIPGLVGLIARRRGAAAP